MAGKSSFRQPIRHGIDTGNPQTTGLGYATITQYAEVSASETSATTKFVIPATQSEGGTFTADIVSIDIHVNTVFEASADGNLHFTLGSAGGTNLGQVHVSASGVYRALPGMSENNDGNRTAFPSVKPAAYFGITGPTAVLCKVSAAGTAPDTGFAYMRLNYVVR